MTLDINATQIDRLWLNDVPLDRLYINGVLVFNGPEPGVETQFTVCTESNGGDGVGFEPDPSPLIPDITNYTENSVKDSSQITCLAPANIAEGDLLFIAVGASNNTGGGPGHSFTVPAGWTVHQSSGGTVVHQSLIMSKIATADDVGQNVTIPWTSAIANAVAIFYAIKDIDGLTPVFFSQVKNSTSSYFLPGWTPNETTRVMAIAFDHSSTASGAAWAGNGWGTDGTFDSDPNADDLTLTHGSKQHGVSPTGNATYVPPFGTVNGFTLYGIEFVPSDDENFFGSITPAEFNGKVIDSFIDDSVAGTFKLILRSDTDPGQNFFYSLAILQLQTVLYSADATYSYDAVGDLATWEFPDIGLVAGVCYTVDIWEKNRPEIVTCFNFLVGDSTTGARKGFVSTEYTSDSFGDFSPIFFKYGRVGSVIEDDSGFTFGFEGIDIPSDIFREFEIVELGFSVLAADANYASTSLGSFWDWPGEFPGLVVGEQYTVKMRGSEDMIYEFEYILSAEEDIVGGTTAVGFIQQWPFSAGSISPDSFKGHGIYGLFDIGSDWFLQIGHQDLPQGYWQEMEIVELGITKDSTEVIYEQVSDGDSPAIIYNAWAELGVNLGFIAGNDYTVRFRSNGALVTSDGASSNSGVAGDGTPVDAFVETYREVGVTGAADVSTTNNIGSVGFGSDYENVEFGDDVVARSEELTKVSLNLGGETFRSVEIDQASVFVEEDAFGFVLNDAGKLKTFFTRFEIEELGYVLRSEDMFFDNSLPGQVVWYIYDNVPLLEIGETYTIHIFY